MITFSSGDNPVADLRLPPVSCIPCGFPPLRLGGARLFTFFCALAAICGSFSAAQRAWRCNRLASLEASRALHQRHFVQFLAQAFELPTIFSMRGNLSETCPMDSANAQTQEA